MVSVYRFKVYDIASDSHITSKYFATTKFINTLQGAEILADTIIEIDEKQLDGDGKFLNQSN